MLLHPADQQVCGLSLGWIREELLFRGKYIIVLLGYRSFACTIVYLLYSQIIYEHCKLISSDFGGSCAPAIVNQRQLCMYSTSPSYKYMYCYSAHVEKRFGGETNIASTAL